MPPRCLETISARSVVTCRYHRDTASLSFRLALATWVKISYEGWDLSAELARDDMSHSLVMPAEKMELKSLRAGLLFSYAW